MRRPLLALLVLSLLLFSGSAMVNAAPREKKRLVVVREYVAPHGVRTTHADEQMRSLPERAPLLFEPRPGDRWVKLDLQDDHGEELYVEIFQEGGDKDLVTDHCGSPGFFKLASDAPLEIKIYSGLCRNHLFGIATTGQIVATFSPSPWGKAIRAVHHH